MAKKRVVLRFPPDLVDQAITYHLIKDYDLVVNILKAKITPREEGELIIDLEGKAAILNKGIKYLENLGIAVQPLARDIIWDENKCVHCTACVGICPTRAFIVDREKMLVSLDKSKCVGCGLCVPACPYQAIQILF